MTNRKVPVLPIPGVVFFPNTALPLYIVDQNCIEMIRHAIENGDGMIAVSLASNNQFHEKNPPSALQLTPMTICTMGRVSILQEFSNGTLQVILEGIQRVKLDQLVQNIPYLVFETREIPDGQSTGESFDHTIERLREILDWWLVHTIPNSHERHNFSRQIQTVPQIVDYLAFFLVRDLEIKQLFLETTSLADRIYMLNSILIGSHPVRENNFVGKIFKRFEVLERVYKVAH